MKVAFPLFFCLMLNSVTAKANNMPPSPERPTYPVENRIFRHMQGTMVTLSRSCFKGDALMFTEKAACRRDAHHVKVLLREFSQVRYQHRNALSGLRRNWESVLGPKLVHAGLLQDASLD